jgi:hypothetical protein
VGGQMSWQDDLVEHFYRLNWENVYGSGSYCGMGSEIHLTTMWEKAKQDAHITFVAVIKYENSDGFYADRDHLIEHLVWVGLSPMVISEILESADRMRELGGNVLSTSH